MGETIDMDTYVAPSLPWAPTAPAAPAAPAAPTDPMDYVDSYLASANQPVSLVPLPGTGRSGQAQVDINAGFSFAYSREGASRDGIGFFDPAGGGTYLELENAGLPENVLRPLRDAPDGSRMTAILDRDNRLRLAFADPKGAWEKRDGRWVTFVKDSRGNAVSAAPQARPSDLPALIGAVGGILTPLFTAGIQYFLLQEQARLSRKQAREDYERRLSLVQAEGAYVRKGGGDGSSGGVTGRALLR